MNFSTSLGTLNYELIGNGELLVLLHGWGQDRQTFASIINFFKKDYKILAIDLLGFGASSEPVKPIGLQEYSTSINDLLNYLELKDPIVLGHSLGGRIAIDYYNRFKGIKRLILVDSAGIRPKRSFSYYFQIYRYKFKRKLFSFLKMKKSLQRLIERSGSDDFKKASPIMKRTLSKIVNTDLKAKLSNIDIETLLIWGLFDDVTPYQDGLVFKQQIKKSQLVTFYNSGHFPYITEEKRFLKVVNKFLKGED